jgi:hypothetical protein
MEIDPLVFSPIAATCVLTPSNFRVCIRLPSIFMNDNPRLGRVFVSISGVPAHHGNTRDVRRGAYCRERQNAGTYRRWMKVQWQVTAAKRDFLSKVMSSTPVVPPAGNATRWQQQSFKRGHLYYSKGSSTFILIRK